MNRIIVYLSILCLNITSRTNWFKFWLFWSQIFNIRYKNKMKTLLDPTRAVVLLCKIVHYIKLLGKKKSY